jgi:hypothetical protein
MGCNCSTAVIAKNPRILRSLPPEKIDTMPHTNRKLADMPEAIPPVAEWQEEQPAVNPDIPKDVHRVYIIWPFHHVSHKTETDSADLAIAAFVQLMRMRHKSFYAIGVGWEINDKLRKYLDFGTGTLHELE